MRKKAAKRNLTIIDDSDDDEVIVKHRKKENVSLDDEDDDDDGFDEFESDDFIVDYEEEEEEGFQENKKRRKSKSVEDIVLDDDDLELLQENKMSGLFPPRSAESEKLKLLKKAGKSAKLGECSGFAGDDDGVSLYDATAKEEWWSDDEDNEMADFIVDDEERYEKGCPRRQWNPEERKPKQVSVASHSALEEAGYLFGDAQELLKRQGLVKIAEPNGINDFEVDEFMLKRDDHVKEADMPERMLIFEEIAGPAPVDEMSREEESSWIHNQLASNMYQLLGINNIQEGNEGVDLIKRVKKEDIARFLKLYHLEKYDIPFIAMYRKEDCLSLLEDPEEDDIGNKYNSDAERPTLKWHKVLWAINELDKKWLLLQQRKSALQTYYDQRFEEECLNVYDTARLSSLRQRFEAIMEALKLAETERNLDDVDTKFSLHFPPAEECLTGRFRRQKKRSQYSKSCKAGLWKLAGKCARSSEQFGLHLMQGKVGMERLENPKEPPLVMASYFLSADFETPEALLEGARHMSAIEISCEPRVRKHVRALFMEKATISTRPTSEGDKAIDSSHQLSAVRWLRDKPLDRFQDAQWLLIQKAEEEKLLQVTIKLPESSVDKLISDSHEIYLVQADDPSTQLWNEQRKLIINDAFLNSLPSLEKETRALLTAKAKNWLCIEYGKQLWSRVSVSPYQYKENGGVEEGIVPRVMACCWGPGKPPTTFVMLDSSGRLLDVLQVGSLSSRSQNVNDQQRRKHDQQRTLKFILIHKPQVVVLGAVNVASTRLKDYIKEIISNMAENCDGGQMMNGINIVYGDESLPQIYENSKVSSVQLPGQEGIVKRAVALGRCLQNPLAMVATLCGAEKDILSWKLHSLDHFLTPDDKYEMIEMVMVEVTNQVGVDVNFTMENDWMFGLLRFISGLGPQKAAFLRQELIGKTVCNRKDLAGCGLGKHKTFYNAVGFLRVLGSELLSFGSEFNSFDDTRIHPESYGLAERFIKAVHDDGVTLAEAIEYIENNPQLLNDFDINAYAENYAVERGENKRQTLHDIKVELLHGFRDPRKPYEELSQDEEFHLVSGRNEDACAEGRIVQAVVRRVFPQRAFCALDTGLSGVIMKEDYADDMDDCSLTDKLHEGEPKIY